MSGAADATDKVLGVNRRSRFTLPVLRDCSIEVLTASRQPTQAPRRASLDLGSTSAAISKAIRKADIKSFNLQPYELTPKHPSKTFAKLKVQLSVLLRLPIVYTAEVNLEILQQRAQPTLHGVTTW